MDGAPLAESAMLCVSPGQSRIIAFDSFAQDSMTSVAIAEDGETAARRFRVGPVDAGASQRHYPLTDAETGADAGSVHMVAPGAYGDPGAIYMPALSSVTIGGERTDCLFDPGMRYMGYSRDSIVTVVEAEEGGLVLSRWRMGEAQPETRRTGGRWTDDGRDLTVFLFPAEDAIYSLAGTRGPLLEYPAWWASTGFMRVATDHPLGYFLADMRRAGTPDERLPYALALHFERLDICRHLAGEWGGGAERNAQVTESWARNGCADLPANQRHFLAAFRGDRAVRDALRLFDLSDLFDADWPHR
ncbi:hypothetical protein [Parasphingopyxis marina]|uniref:Uncharacterized protein n=1 Tax=Parasphingopyxis marina TaxID=2761622 RepID=A0A842HWG6_9SPHN|nr:hypothetical protein [Parasphingopyxis marina]MBC2778448.1 hypothetical protein [Parasphingopyxis marina]